jgi:hypothetical protein
MQGSQKHERQQKKVRLRRRRTTRKRRSTAREMHTPPILPFVQATRAQTDRAEKEEARMETRRGQRSRQRRRTHRKRKKKRKTARKTMPAEKKTHLQAYECVKRGNADD